MKHIYTLFIALIASVTFGQYAVGTSTLFSGGGAAYPHVLIAATPADGNTGEAVTMVMNVTSLPAGGANFRIYKTNAGGTGVFGSTLAITLGENTITVAAVDFARAVKFQFDPAAADVEFDQVSINGVELLGNVDFKTGYASGELSNNPNWKAGTGKYVVDPAAGTATVEADYAKAVMGQPFKMMADGDALTYKLDFALNSTLGSANKILLRSGFTHVNGTGSSGANENVVHISINSWNGSLAVRNNSNVGDEASGFQGVFLNPADVNNATVSIEVTLTLGADAASSTISGKLVSSTGNESTVGSYTGIQDALYTAATTGDGIYAMFNSAALSQCGADGGPLTGGVSLSNLSVTPPATADTTAPVITLAGDAVMELTVGDTYTDPGFSASDDTDGDLTNSVVVAGDTVDTNAAGQYIVTYNVSDAAGNTASEVTRTVNVSAPAAPAALSLQGIMDIDVAGGVGKAIHLVVISDISDLSIYEIGSANNQQGTDGPEFTFPDIAATAGQHILVTNSASDATGADVFLNGYLNASVLFDVVINGASAALQGNGNDAYELFSNGVVIETFGVTGNVGDDSQSSDYSMEWAYNDSWAYKVDDAWTYGGPNCTDSSTTTWDSNCVYPFAVGKETLGVAANSTLQSVVAYPNPTRDFWNVEATSTLKSVQLFDVVGRELMRFEPNANTVRISTKTLKSGIYFAKINDGEMMKLIKR